MKFRTVALVVTLALGILATPLSSDAQERAKLPRIGFLSVGRPATHLHLLEAFRQGLRELGYVEGQNIAFDVQWTEGKYEPLPELAAELVRRKVGVIVAVGGPVAVAAKNATRTIPIVMAPSGDPVGSGLVASLARPGGNITGLSSLATELSGKRLELLMEIVPARSRAAVLLNPASPTSKIELHGTEIAAQALGVQLQLVEVRSPNGFERAFSAMARARAGALTVLADPMIISHQARIVDLSAKNRLPAVFWRTEFAEAGGLIAYGPHLPDLLRRAAHYVDKILKGAKPADLPVEQPMRFELVINLKTAKALGLTIPQSVLFRADKVIE